MSNKFNQSNKSKIEKEDVEEYVDEGTGIKDRLSWERQEVTEEKLQEVIEDEETFTKLLNEVAIVRIDGIEDGDYSGLPWRLRARVWWMLKVELPWSIWIDKKQRYRRMKKHCTYVLREEFERGVTYHYLIVKWDEDVIVRCKLLGEERVAVLENVEEANLLCYFKVKEWEWRGIEVLETDTRNWWRSQDKEQNKMEGV